MYEVFITGKNTVITLRNEVCHFSDAYHTMPNMGSTEVKICITHELNGFKKNKELESNQRRYITQAQEGTFNSSSLLLLIQQSLRRRPWYLNW
jgi:hypothetical protein